jgi:two-component sensor histidine kinase
VAASINEAENCIISMMTLYDKLYCSDGFGSLSVHQYFYSLVDEIILNFPNRSIVKVVKNIEDFIMDVKILAPLGIIANEILTNVMKYAFTGKESGIIIFSASKKDGLATISIGDNGIGIPESVDFENSTGFGMCLVSMLVDQIGGNIRIERVGGTKFIIEFPLQ